MRPAVWKVRIAAALCLFFLVLLLASGRILPGPTYPVGMVLIAFCFSFATLGYLLAKSMIPTEKPPAPPRNAFPRVRAIASSPLFQWPCVVICILGRFWWGWYVVLAVLLRGLWRGSKGTTPRLPGMAGVFLAYGWIPHLLMMGYVLLNKSFFAR